MSLACGIVGLPNVGKSTLFNAMTHGDAAASNYAFCTRKPNTGIVALEDERLDFLARLLAPERKVKATMTFVDIAGLIRNAHKGEGLGNEFLGNIRSVDAIIHLVRCFEDTEVVHTSSTLDPVEDLEVITTELLLADLAVVDRHLEKARKMQKSAQKEYFEKADLLERVRERLDRGEWLADGEPIPKNEKERTWLKSWQLLACKPVLFVGNCAEDVVVDPLADPVCKAFAEAVKARSKAAPFFISAKVEAELAGLDDEEADAFREELGIPETGLSRLVAVSYAKLGLITFLTHVGPECRAWSIPAGTPAVEAAGKIHTDMQKGFIRAEVVAYDDLAGAGSIQSCKDKGLLRLEGKEYPVADGDVVTFRFNV